VYTVYVYSAHSVNNTAGVKNKDITLVWLFYGILLYSHISNPTCNLRGNFCKLVM